MDQVDLAPIVGIVACLGVVGALVAPYVLTVPSGVGSYYGTGVVNPLVAGLLALVTVIVFAAGRQERTDPQLAAGTALVFGVFVLMIVLGWGLTTRVDTIQITTSHRWVTAAFAFVIPASGAWYARALGLF